MREKELEKIKEYKYGFSTDIETIKAPKGLNEEVIKFISNIKKEPSWMLDWRLKSYKSWLKMKEPDWSKLKYPKIDFNEICYYSAPKKKSLNSLLKRFQSSMQRSDILRELRNRRYFRSKGEQERMDKARSIRRLRRRVRKF